MTNFLKTFFHQKTQNIPSKILYNIQGDNNKIIVLKNDNTEYELDLKNETYPGLFVEIFGDNNTIKIREPFKCDGTKILIGSAIQKNNNSFIEFGKSFYFLRNVFHINWGHSQRVKIADHVTTYDCSMSLPETASIDIGEDCMFASGVVIRAADGHAVFNAQSGEIINKDKYTTRIGKHCWIGRNATILKKASIPDNSIVAECSVITKDFSKTVGGILLAGNPAQIKSEDINWSRKSATYYLENNINLLDETNKVQ